ncbi:MAG: molybdopterin-synthase adenylyltransferase MoeB [Candidatus Kariarchaeaceae archaeon]
MNKSKLTNEEIKRYQRHLTLSEVGINGQHKLKNAKVLIVGVGGLGSPIALYLAAAGVGTIGLVDFDLVDLSNLQRQIMYSTVEIGKSKLNSAKQRIKALNPNVTVEVHEEILNSENVLGIFEGYDIICDGTDNFPTRYLVNDACVLLDKPNVYGSIFQFEGQISIFYAKQGPCYRCLYSEPPPVGVVPSCAEGGVLGVLPGIIGTIQANEIIKLVISKGNSLIGRLLLFDALDMTFNELRIQKNPTCLICGPNPSITQLIDYDEFCGINIESIDLEADEKITPNELKQLINTNYPLQLIDVREAHESELSNIQNSILVPLHTIIQNLELIDNKQLVVLYCKSGIRSAQAASLLKSAGYQKLKNLVGGIDAWNMID